MRKKELMYIYGYESGKEKYYEEKFYLGLISDLYYQHSCLFNITVNETHRNIHFIFKQMNMHRKNWKWKWEKLLETQDLSFDLFQPDFRYNSARRLARVVNRSLKNISSTFDYDYESYPNYPSRPNQFNP